MLDHQNTTIATTANDDTAAQTSYYGTAGADAGNVRYDPFAAGQLSAEHGLADIDTIKPRSRDQYVALFKKTEERTAKSTLQMCRVVYEAQQSLQEHEFADFCTAVGYKDTSSVIRKFCAIGKLQPRLVNHAAFMPHEWTKIYTLTQIPAQLFESYVAEGTDFRGLTGKQLKDLVDATRPETKQLSTLLPRDKDSNNFVFAKLTFDKTFVDAYDWRAVKKALAEVESRLPIKVQFVAAAEKAYQQTVAHRYTQAKQNARKTEFKPALWDFGIEAAQDNLKDDPADANTIDSSASTTKAIE
ncbi:hypothetical protein RAZWK3B_11717 [Roseobacter sp. AzwK-3b]|uniref:hypothetical protein n=1 Tax=Roseobacter sp. AzwK-3b TaxID=351016 RepID=UPI000156A1C3|nr:hypothetical protein [Roseobacter sp. AzwK-3b]EDM69404.1 hypothetical protein RAZWK3B_11717 [Roseobacter sp. AzwK-3b]